MKLVAAPYKREQKAPDKFKSLFFAFPTKSYAFFFFFFFNKQQFLYYSS